MNISVLFYFLLAQAQVVKIEQKKETVVYRENIEQYNDRLIAPIASWVESDIFRFKVLEKEISQESVNQDLVIQKVIESQNIAKNVIYDADFAWLTGENLLRKAKVIFYRKYSAFPPDQQQDILYEEVFRFIEPAVVNSYSTQSFRFTKEDNDQISHYSPVVGAVRPIQTANRSDSIIDGEITLDDIFVFSANPRQFNFKLVDQKVLYVPFASEASQAVEKAAPLFSYKNNAMERFDLTSSSSYPTLVGKQSSVEQRSLTLWNYEVKAFSSHAAWLPLTVVFEPRKVLIYELSSKDPFYLSGKQFLIVDALNGLPYYKLVYSHSGQFLKTVIGGWQKVSIPEAYASAIDNKASHFVPAFVLAVDSAARNATVLSVHNAQFYFDKEPNLDFVFSDQRQKSSEESAAPDTVPNTAAVSSAEQESSSSQHSSEQHPDE